MQLVVARGDGGRLGSIRKERLAHPVLPRQLDQQRADQDPGACLLGQGPEAARPGSASSATAFSSTSGSGVPASSTISGSTMSSAPSPAAPGSAAPAPRCWAPCRARRSSARRRRGMSRPWRLSLGDERRIIAARTSAGKELSDAVAGSERLGWWNRSSNGYLVLRSAGMASRRGRRMARPCLCGIFLKPSFRAWDRAKQQWTKILPVRSPS